jgi:hypothetical protein
MDTQTKIRLHLDIPIQIPMGGLDQALDEVVELIGFDSCDKRERQSASVPGVFASIVFSRKVTKNGKTYRFGINHTADGISQNTRIFLSPMGEELHPQEEEFHSFELEEGSRSIPRKQLKNSFDNFFSEVKD